MPDRFTRGVAALAGLVLAGTGLATATAAPAAAAVSDCPTGYFCAWTAESPRGTMYKTNKDVADLGAWSDKFRTTVNRSSLFACLYDDKNHDPYGGYELREPDDAGEYSVSPTATISSIRFTRTERECGRPQFPDWSAEPAPKAAGFGDLNGDRRADVLVRDKVGRLFFASGNGTGSMIGSGGWNGMNALTRHGDFSRDGKEDLIAREKATGKLWLYPGTGTGALGARKLIGSGGWNAMKSITAFGDLTGDGRSDLLAIESATGKLWLYPGTAGGALGGRTLLGSGGWNAMNALVAAGDMNGDGRPDLYAREAATGKLYFYPGRASALGGRTLLGSGWHTMADFFAVGDYTGDGRLDLATVTNEQHRYPVAGMGNPGWLVLYGGKGDGLLYGGRHHDGEWWGLNGFF
ncbi:FG-GAP-like repeat-containing protein [Streptomyces sp. NPDC097619]|uniref:FG-GAP-like repeat-containing protein n=1 Tax=Streptomyces sp. NPDC097619 TaxID=3157228 RepID=UPI003329B9B2